MTSADCHLISASARFHMELWDLHSLCKQDAASLRAGSCALCTQRRLHIPACAGRVYIKRCTRSQLISLFGVGVWGGVGRSQDGTKYWWIRWRVAAAPASKAVSLSPGRNCWPGRKVSVRSLYHIRVHLRPWCTVFPSRASNYYSKSAPPTRPSI